MCFASIGYKKTNCKLLPISIYTEDFRNEYISLTDIAKYRNADDPRYVIQNWMRNPDTVEFLGLWEMLHNANFNRVQFDAVKSEAGSNRFVMTPTKWVELTNAQGIICKSGRYLQIIDMTGRTVCSEKVSGSYDKTLNLKAGVYVVKLNGMTQKIVVK